MIITLMVTDNTDKLSLMRVHPPPQDEAVEESGRTDTVHVSAWKFPDRSWMDSLSPHPQGQH